MINRESVKKKSIFLGLVCAGICGLVVIAGYNDVLNENRQNLVLQPPDIEENDKPTWHDEGKYMYDGTRILYYDAEEYKWIPVGENDPGGANSGFCSFWHMEFTNNPNGTLANNATDWSANATSRGYIDETNAGNTDLEANIAGYFVCRAKFNDDAIEGATWNHSRYRVIFNLTGDETADTLYVYDNSTESPYAGDAVVSANTADQIWINFFLTDDNDGYRILPDGQINWNVTIQSQY